MTDLVPLVALMTALAVRQLDQQHDEHRHYQQVIKAAGKRRRDQCASLFRTDTPAFRCNQLLTISRDRKWHYPLFAPN
jgi:hypothetical protein